MKQIVILSLILFPFLTIAQDETYKPAGSNVEAQAAPTELTGEYAVVPFPDRLFKCHFAKELTAQNNMSFEELRSFFQTALNEQLTTEFNKKSTAVNTNALGDSGHEINVIQENIAFNYEPIPVKEEELSKTEKLKHKLNLKKKKEEPEQTGTYIKEGQVVTHRDTRAKYLASTIKNTDFLSLIQGFHNNKFLLVINQLEIIYPPQADQLALQHENYKKLIRVHFTYFNMQGESISGGIADAYVGAEVKDINQIATEAFTSIAPHIVSESPEIENTSESNNH